jgi:hypothetical protein
VERPRGCGIQVGRLFQDREILSDACHILHCRFLPLSPGRFFPIRSILKLILI